MGNAFKQRLAFGQIAEGWIATWLRRRCHYTVLPVYETEIDNGKGPRLWTPNQSLVAPDMLIMRPDSVKWVEAKRKSVFSWHRNTQRWVTGIDLRHYQDYIRISQTSPWPVWLLFLHTEERSNEGCERCPVGLFGGEISYLAKRENHQSDKWGKGGMVYWAHGTLKLLATLGEVRSAQASSQQRDE